jgi:AraC-like DNA-binding protein
MLAVQTSLPESVLRPFIRAYVQREARLGAQELVEPVVARLGVMLEFEFAGAYEVRNYGSERLDATFPISIIGPQTWRRARLIIRNHVESLVVMFQPAGFHALFGVPTAPLAEAGTEGHAVLGPGVSRLHQRLGNLRTFRERCELLDRYFLARLGDAGAMDPIYKALHLLTAPHSTYRVEEVARMAGINRRYLERKALAVSGVSPKALTRISRFSRALLMRSETTQTWTEIAYATGYHDQMHMIRDFRVFAGDAPTSALQEISPDHLINFALNDTPVVA